MIQRGSPRVGGLGLLQQEARLPQAPLGLAAGVHGRAGMGDHRRLGGSHREFQGLGPQLAMPDPQLPRGLGIGIDQAIHLTAVRLQ